MVDTSAAFVLAYIVAMAILVVYLVVLATRLVSAQHRTAKALETIAARLPDTRNG